MRVRCSRTVLRRTPEQALLHAVVREHLATFLAEVRLRGGGQGLPSFVERELRERCWVSSAAGRVSEGWKVAAARSLQSSVAVRR